MILISHNCLAGHLYHLIGQKYACPFIWTVIDFNSMKTLIIEWDKINFKNYKLEKDKNWNFKIVIDNKINVQYVHYKFDPTSSILVKKGPGDICYNRIWEYIISKYEKRINRMNKETSKPIFCIANFNTIFPDAVYTEEQLKELEKYENVKILRGCEKIEPIPTAIQFYNNFLRK
jgi:hypothetical protein